MNMIYTKCCDCKYYLYEECSHPDADLCNYGELWWPIEDDSLEYGCEYCEDYEDLPEHYIDGEFVGKVFDTSIEQDGDSWHITLPNGADIGIKYCPFCGRKLNE